MKQAVNLDKIRVFYDPHPGFAGAAISMPAKAKEVADKLNGQKLSLRNAMKALKKVTDGTLSIVAEDFKFIMLKIKTDDGAEHFFRVIRFK